MEIKKKLTEPKLRIKSKTKAYVEHSFLKADLCPCYGAMITGRLLFKIQYSITHNCSTIIACTEKKNIGDSPFIRN